MAERRPPADAEMERALTDLGRRLDWPPTPDLARAVRTRLAVAPARRRPFPAFLLQPGRGMALAALALLLAVAAAVLAVPAARTTVAEWFGLRGVEIRPVTTTPTAAPSPFASVIFPGERVTLAEARARAGFTVRAPELPELGPPDEVYLGQGPLAGQVALVYRARPGLPQAAQVPVGLLLTQFRSSIELPVVLQKQIGPGTELEPVRVGNTRGFWIEGRPHRLIYQDAAGRSHDESSRLAGNTLLWERDGITYRLESALSRDEALRIAESLR